MPDGTSDRLPFTKVQRSSSSRPFTFTLPLHSEINLLQPSTSASFVVFPSHLFHIKHCCHGVHKNNHTSIRQIHSTSIRGPSGALTVFHLLQIALVSFRSNLAHPAIRFHLATSFICLPTRLFHLPDLFSIPVRKHNSDERMQLGTGVSQQVVKLNMLSSVLCSHARAQEI